MHLSCSPKAKLENSEHATQAFKNVDRALSADGPRRACETDEPSSKRKSELDPSGRQPGKPATPMPSTASSCKEMLDTGQFHMLERSGKTAPRMPASNAVVASTSALPNIARLPAHIDRCYPTAA